MGKILIVVGVVTIAYTTIAHFIGLPQISDLLPVDLFAGSKGSYYKVVQSTEASYASYYTIGVGILFVLAGFFLKSKSTE